MARGRIAGHRKRAFRIRSDQVPDAVHIVMEFIHDMCLEMGVCTQCHLKLLYHKGNRVYSKCKDCLEYNNKYARNGKRRDYEPNSHR